MKLYKVKQGIVIERDKSFYLIKDQNWNAFINDDNLSEKIIHITKSLSPSAEAIDLIANGLQPPIQSQEIWGAGVTYLRSKVGRQEEAKDAGGGEFYARVYEADRPEIFFKATPHRVVGHGQNVRIRKDSTWDAPEPELTLVITSSGKITGYTIGNDMSSRSIEGENPLYLPQAKTYDKSAATGPCLYITDDPLPEDTLIQLVVYRGEKIFEGSVAIKQIKRKFQELVAWLYKESSFPHGCFLMTGTGIVPDANFTLHKNDEIHITIEPIGTLVNVVEVGN